MTVPEFLSWQATKRLEAKERAAAQAGRPDPAGSRSTATDLPELGALGPAGIAQAIGGR